MYSVVLMMALSGGSEAVDFGHRRACNGCTGAVAACSGHACTGHAVVVGCAGSACHGRAGCHGRAAHGCHGAIASCSGSCHGGCHGGGLFSRLHNRCHGCNGGGCHGGVVCTGYSGCAGCAGGVIVAPKAETPKVMPKEEKKKTTSVAPATIVVSLPADATLTVDGAPTTSTSAQRTLITPALETDSTYVYTLAVQVNGQTQTRQIQVRGGETTQAQFSFPEGLVSR